MIRPHGECDSRQLKGNKEHQVRETLAKTLKLDLPDKGPKRRPSLT